MVTGALWIAGAATAAVLAILIAAPICLFVFGVVRNRRNPSVGAKVLIGAGPALCLAYLTVIAACIATVGPYRSGILSQGESPNGFEYCVVQTYKPRGFIGEPYQVSFYMRDDDRIWRWQYLAHDDNAWRDVTVAFSGDKALVSHGGHPPRELKVPAGSPDAAAIPGSDNHLPAAYSTEDVLKWHNAKFERL